MSLWSISEGSPENNTDTHTAINHPQICRKWPTSQATKEKLTNFGLNIGEYGADVEGKLLGKGTVFGDSSSFPGIIEPLLHTGLSHRVR